jgi:hypothetical protein
MHQNFIRFIREYYPSSHLTLLQEFNLSGSVLGNIYFVRTSLKFTKWLVRDVLNFPSFIRLNAG